MQYELKSVKAVGNPYTNKVLVNKNYVEKYGINIVVTVGIVGNTYNGFCNNDGMFFELKKGQTIEQNEADMNTFAVQYVENKYPNT